MLLTVCAWVLVIVKCCMYLVGRGQKYSTPVSEQEVRSCLWRSQKDEPVSSMFFMSLLVFLGDMVVNSWFSKVYYWKSDSLMDVRPLLAWQWGFHSKAESLFQDSQQQYPLSNASYCQASVFSLALPGSECGVFLFGALLLSVICWLIPWCLWNLNVWTGWNHALLYCFID